LTAGAEVNHVNNEGETALYWAAGHLEAIQALLMVGANVNHASNLGWTALYAAAQKGMWSPSRRC
jgi:ankyrin repeat protein